MDGVACKAKSTDNGMRAKGEISGERAEIGPSGTPAAVSLTGRMSCGNEINSVQ